VVAIRLRDLAAELGRDVESDGAGPES